jgi:hypothetical protein
MQAMQDEKDTVSEVVRSFGSVLYRRENGQARQNHAPEKKEDRPMNRWVYMWPIMI